jgi:hypothetical protein
VEGSGRGLTWGTVLASAWRDWGKLYITNTRQDCRCPGKIRTQPLPNAIPMHCCSLGTSDDRHQLITKLYSYWFLSKSILTIFWPIVSFPASVQEKVLHYRTMFSADGRMWLANATMYSLNTGQTTGLWYQNWYRLAANSTDKSVRLLTQQTSS